jgi:hypothetical protein
MNDIGRPTKKAFAFSMNKSRFAPGVKTYMDTPLSTTRPWVI